LDITYRFNPYEPLLPRQVETADGALQFFRDGHLQFREICRRIQAAALGNAAPGEAMVIPSCPLARGLSLVPGQAPPQQPLAIVLSCSDSRVPVEELFQVSANSVFVVRVAGNLIGTEILGSLFYALEHFRKSVKLVIVLGHTACGAVTAAVDSFLHAGRSGDIVTHYALRSLVDRLLLPVRMASHAQSGDAPPDPSSRAALIESAAYVNAALTAYDLRGQLGLSIDDGIRVTYGVYDLRTMRVQSFPGVPAPQDSADFLSEAPRDPAALAALAGNVAGLLEPALGAQSMSDVVLPENWRDLAGR
jgi:carbonic anhydrase